MAAPTPSRHSSSRSQHRVNSPEARQRRRRPVVSLVLLLAILVALVAGDSIWLWRDSLRRLANGEEIPAFRAPEWAHAQSIREGLAEDLLKADLSPAAQERSTCRDLALYTLISAAGDEVISRGGPAMGELMEELCVDIDGLEDMVYFCQMNHAETALPILAHLYQKEKRKMEDSLANRRLAVAMAFEFAHAGLGQEEALKAFRFYTESGKKHTLNTRFDALALWEMGPLAARMTDFSWCNTPTLEWFQSNNRLPARGYVTLGQSLGTHELSLFGCKVNSPAFLAVYQGASNNAMASIYETSGCSSAKDRALYAATAACANGVPAVVVTGRDSAACLVDVNGEWEASGTVEGTAESSWCFWGQKHPDFAKLASLLGREHERTLASARLAQLAQFLYDAGNIPLALSYYREAVKVQPLNYAAWVGYHTCGASAEEMGRARACFAELPGVAAALGALRVE